MFFIPQCLWNIYKIIFCRPQRNSQQILQVEIAEVTFYDHQTIKLDINILKFKTWKVENIALNPGLKRK